MRSSAPVAPSLTGDLRPAPFFIACYPACFGKRAHRIVFDRNPNVLEFHSIKLNSRISQDLADEKPAEEITNGQSIRPGYFIHVIGSDSMPSTRHILH